MASDLSLQPDIRLISLALKFVPCFALAACASMPGATLIEAPEQSPIALAAWSQPLPPKHQNWSLLDANDRCLVLSARKTLKDLLISRCLDPKTGELNWEHSLPLKRSEQVQSLTTHDHLIHITRNLVSAIDLSTGEIAWSFDPGQGRDIYGGAIVEDLIVLAIPEEMLAIVNTHSGQWVRGIALAQDNLQAVISSPAGPLALVFGPPEPGSDGDATLKAIKLLGDGGEDIAAASWPKPLQIWGVNVSISEAAAPFHLNLKPISDTFAGSLHPGKLSTIDALSGKLLTETHIRPGQKVTRHKTKAPLLKHRRTHKVQTPGPLSITQILRRAELVQTPPLGHPGQFRLHTNNPSVIITQEQVQGTVLATLVIRAFNPRDLSMLWETPLPWKEVVQNQHLLSHDTSSLFINSSHASILNISHGEILWQAPLKQHHWKQVSFNGRAIFLLYTGRNPRIIAIRPH